MNWLPTLWCVGAGRENATTMAERAHTVRGGEIQRHCHRPSSPVEAWAQHGSSPEARTNLILVSRLNFSI